LIAFYTHVSDQCAPFSVKLVNVGIRDGAINIRQIRTHWDEILRLATSIRQGTVTASLILRKLGNYPRQNGLAVALREFGRIERTLFNLD
jgi:TnpA family transposase